MRARSISAWAWVSRCPTIPWCRNGWTASTRAKAASAVRDHRLAVVAGDGVGRFEADACGIVPAIERAARSAAVELVQQRDQTGDMVRGRQLWTPRARLERQRREDHVVADRMQPADGAPQGSGDGRDIAPAGAVGRRREQLGMAGDQPVELGGEGGGGGGVEPLFLGEEVGGQHRGAVVTGVPMAPPHARERGQAARQVAVIQHAAGQRDSARRAPGSRRCRRRPRARRSSPCARPGPRCARRA